MKTNFPNKKSNFRIVVCTLEPLKDPKMSGSSTTTATSQLQSSGMLSKEQLLHLFNRFTFLTSLPDVKNRIAEAVKDQQEEVLLLKIVFADIGEYLTAYAANATTVSSMEAVAATTAIQEEIFLEMGVDPSFGLSCLGKVNTYENDQELMIRFLKFVAREEMACDEAELGPDEFTERMHSQQKLHEQQLEMLKHMRKYHLDDQSAMLEKLHQQMKNTNYEGGASVLSSEQIQEIVQRRVSPLFSPR